MTLLENNNELVELLKAAFCAGFRVGKDAGGAAASAFEVGSRTMTTQNPEKAWDEEVRWRINSDTSSHMDVFNLEHWENVP